MAQALSVADYKTIGIQLNTLLKKYNYQVAPKLPAGGKPRAGGYTREFRLQLINTQQDTSDAAIAGIPGDLKKIKEFKSIKFNSLSPNSSKFPSIEFSLFDNKIDLVVARGANKGENFEKATVTNLASAFKLPKNASADMKILIGELSKNKAFDKVDIVSIKQRTGSTKKEGIPIEKLGAIIGDIVLTDSTGKDWFISLKDVNGYTFSSYSGAASLFNDGDIVPNSAGAEFLDAFGADLNQVQAGFDLRNNVKKVRKKIAVKRPDTNKLKAIFERAWGMNYFYVKKETNGWKVFWLDRAKLDKLTKGIIIDNIKYPTLQSKQISIECHSQAGDKYLVELRNSKAGEYPNDTKIKIRK